MLHLRELLSSPTPALHCRVKDRTRTQLQRLASFLQATQPFFQQLQPEVIRDVRSPIEQPFVRLLRTIRCHKANTSQLQCTSELQCSCMAQEVSCKVLSLCLVHHAGG